MLISGLADWHLYVGVHGQWKIFETLSVDKKGETLNLKERFDGTSFEFLLHQDDTFRITSGGFEADEMHGQWGKTADFPGVTSAIQTYPPQKSKRFAANSR